MKTRSKIFSISVLLLGIIQTASAEQLVVDKGREPAFMDHIPEICLQPIFYLWVLIGFAFFMAMYSLLRVNKVLLRLVNEKDAVPEVVKVQAVKTQSAWSKFTASLTKAVPVEREKDVMLDHDYDGIRELDNQLPPWWKWGFVVTIIFAIVYLGYFHVSKSGKLQVAEYDEEMREAAIAKEEMMKKNQDMVTEASVAVLTDQPSIDAGKKTFQTYCVACHGDKAQGNVGPNLTDEYWLHGGGIKHVFHTITEGVPVKGMISWKTQLSPKQIQQVASFVLSLHGSHPAGAKPPQGDIYTDEPTSATTPSAKPDTTHPSKQIVSSL